jgi:hypothetical protein
MNDIATENVLTELWAIKDARAKQFGNVASLVKHLREVERKSACQEPSAEALHEAQA